MFFGGLFFVNVLVNSVGWRADVFFVGAPARARNELFSLNADSYGLWLGAEVSYFDGHLVLLLVFVYFFGGP